MFGAKYFYSVEKLLTIEEMKKERVPINFMLSKEVDQKFRIYLAKKYSGFHKGVLAKELELAISHFVDEQTEERE